jgi:cyclophilin family peptidyl-prolyl cis-trans isomerase
MREAYSTVGGIPHLDQAYTVFGEVIEGLDIIDKIATEEIDGNDRPLKDVEMKITIIQ